METFVGTKIVQAESAERDGVLGYRVTYPDGYESWSPPEAFEEAYRLSGELKFGHALELLHRGEAVARHGWNGKGMFLYLVGAGNYPAASPVAKAHWGDEGVVPYRPYIAIKSVNGEVVPWVASQSDILSDDWEIVAVEAEAAHG
jgi:hypothetical protein